MMRIAILAILPAIALAGEPVRARHAMIASGEPHATDAGVKVLQTGGNAIDAAVTVAFALGVTHSAMCGLGGGGYAVIRMADGRSTFFDFREQAPSKAHRDMFRQPDGALSPDSQVGWRAAAVPGQVKGFEAMHRKFGRKPWADLLRPAIDLAGKGHPVSYSRAEALRKAASLARDAESRRIFQNGGRFFKAGDILRQPELARTLERIARSGSREFYEGQTARRFAREAAKHGSLISLRDLKAYAIAESAPLEGRYKGYEILTAAGSSSGGIGLLQMLGVLEGTGFEKHGEGSAAAYHYMAEAMRRFFADRSEYIGDPAFSKTRVKALLDPAYLARLRQSIDAGRATPSDTIRPGALAPSESSETTHFSILDAEGNAASITITLNSGYGSGVTVPGLGFLLNNNMDNFASLPGKTNQYGLRQGEVNAIQPGKRPVSSMAPAIVLKQGKPYLIVGTPGGPTIMNSVMQAIINVVDFGRNAYDAIALPRIHHQWYPDELDVEKGVSPDAIAALRARGHKVNVKGPRNDMMAIRVAEDAIEGAADPRHQGKAAGY